MEENQPSDYLPMAPPEIAHHHVRIRKLRRCRRFPSSKPLEHFVARQREVIDKTAHDAKLISFLCVEVATIELSLSFIQNIMNVIINPDSPANHEDSDFTEFWGAMCSLLSDVEDLLSHGERLQQLWKKSSGFGTEILHTWVAGFMKDYNTLEERRRDLLKNYACFIPPQGNESNALQASPATESTGTVLRGHDAEDAEKATTATGNEENDEEAEKVNTKIGMAAEMQRSNIVDTAATPVSIPFSLSEETSNIRSTMTSLPATLKVSGKATKTRSVRRRALPPPSSPPPKTHLTESKEIQHIHMPEKLNTEIVSLSVANKSMMDHPTPPLRDPPPPPQEILQQKQRKHQKKPRPPQIPPPQNLQMEIVASKDTSMAASLIEKDSKRCILSESTSKEASIGGNSTTIVTAATTSPSIAQNDAIYPPTRIAPDPPMPNAGT